MAPSRMQLSSCIGYVAQVCGTQQAKPGLSAFWLGLDVIAPVLSCSTIAATLLGCSFGAPQGNLWLGRWSCAGSVDWG